MQREAQLWTILRTKYDISSYADLEGIDVQSLLNFWGGDCKNLKYACKVVMLTLHTLYFCTHLPTSSLLD